MKNAQKLTVSINPIYIIVLLLIVIIAMFALWRPWEDNGKIERTVTITGQAEVEAAPDEFTFSPYFQRTGKDTAALKKELDAYGNTLMSELTALGVNQDDITLSSNSYDAPTMSIEPSAGSSSSGQPGNSENTVSLSVTIKTTDKKEAQKIQDYLAKTDAKGQLTPMPSFSKTKQKQLETSARQKAVADAKTKAEQTAKNAGASIGRVVTIKDSGSPNSIVPMPAIAEDSAGGTTKSLPITPGKDTVTMNVEVVFELK